MIKTIIQRIAQLIPILLIVASIVFVITRMIPGNPAATILGPQAPKEAVEELTIELGLDKSIPEQYISYMANVLKGDFGKSYHYNQPVMELILKTFPNTVILTVISLLIATIIAIPIGIISATKQYSIFDYISMIFALVGVSMPIFWLGLMLVLIFSVNLGWLPSFGMGSLKNGLWDVISHLILPCIFWQPYQRQHLQELRAPVC